MGLLLISIVLVSMLLTVIIMKFKVILITKWCRSQTCLVGKTAIITGANTGIGYETALDFAKRGARVVLACRNREKAEKARDKIVNETGNGNVVVKIIDMSSFASVRAFAKEVRETEDRLDILVNNAGIADMENSRTEDGHSLTLQVNYFSSFLLTNLLIGMLKKSGESRIINLASIMAMCALNFDVNKLYGCSHPFFGYAYSKLCNILFTIELAKKLKGTGVSTYSIHPGVINTGIFKYLKGPYKILFYVCRLFFKTPEEGAQTVVYCAVTKRIEEFSGSHFWNCQNVPHYNTTKPVGLSGKLWKVTEEIVELKSKEMHL